MRNSFVTFLVWFGLFAAACLFVFPSFSDSLMNISQTTKISSYSADVDQMTDGELEEELLKAYEYNEKVFEQQKLASFFYRGETATDPEYEDVLATSSTGTMAFIEIPKIGVYLPIVHGTWAEDLETAVGHMYGTSVPVGGESAHAVLTAHTGLPTADLFTQLTDLKEGDRFSIHVLGEEHVYRIDRILVVLPSEEAPYLQIKEGFDYITLYTCTPYGINDHRLLVRGVRSTTEEGGDLTYEAEEQVVRAKNLKAFLKTVGFALIPLIILVIGIVRTAKTAARNRRERKKRAEEKAAAEAGDGGEEQEGGQPEAGDSREPDGTEEASRAGGPDAEEPAPGEGDTEKLAPKR